jgi:glycosyltransferase involved in cell wall biosynthesis
MARIRKKRIALFTSEFSPLRGGIGTYAAELARAATELGSDVTVFAPRYNLEDFEDDRDKFPFRVVRFQGGRHTFKDLPRKFSVVRSAARDQAFDVFHAADWPFFLPVSQCARSKRKLYTVHGSEITDMQRPAKRHLIRLLQPFRGDFEVIGNSSFTISLFRRAFPEVAETNTRFSLLGISPFWLAEANASLQPALSYLPADKFIVLTVGRLTPRKGHLEVLRALAILPQDVQSEICYVIVGPNYDEEYRKALEDAARDLSCTVRIIGEVSDEALRAIYSRSDVFCLSGKQSHDGLVEGFGLVYIEAGGQSLPSIAGNLGGMAEAVHHDASGLVVSSDNVAELAAAIAHMKEDNVTRGRLSRGAKMRAEFLSWQRCAIETYKLDVDGAAQ